MTMWAIIEIFISEFTFLVFSTLITADIQDT